MSSVKCWTFVLLGILLLFGVGCSKNLQITGKVTYSDDGTPLDAGMIIFEDGNMASRSDIGTDGTFKLSSMTQNDGIPPGTYKVYFSGALKAEEGGMLPRPVYLLAPKYNNPDTTDITITIDKSTKSPLEIKVDRFGTQ